MSLFSTINNDDNKNLINSFSFGFNNQLKDCTIDFLFNGLNIQEKNNNAIYMSIITQPEYSHASFEELRLADNEKEKTGKIDTYKIKNTSSQISIFNNNEGTSLFGNNDNNKQTFGLFGNINNGQNTPLFGNNDNNKPTCGLFGN